MRITLQHHQTPAPGSTIGSPIRAKAMGSLFVAGATIGAVSLILPHPAEADATGLWSNVVLAYVAGAAIFFLGRGAPQWFFHVALAAGAVLITRAVLLSHEPVSFYTAWYVWIGLYAFYFFSRRAAALHVAFAAALYALTIVHESPSSPVARWLTVVATLVVAGAFIDTLVRRAHEHASTAAATAASMALVARVAHELSGVTDADFARARLCAAAQEVTGCDQVILWVPTADGTGLTATSCATGEPLDSTLTSSARPPARPRRSRRSPRRPGRPTTPRSRSWPSSARPIPRLRSGSPSCALARRSPYSPSTGPPRGRARPTRCGR